MNTQNYHKSIITAVSTEEAFTKISSVKSWWTTSITDTAKHLNDVFTTWDGEKDKITLQVVEAVPNKKWVWLVTDCQLHWLNDPTEWKNTCIVFEISERNQQTRIDMTHVGLIPGIECYNVCKDGWNHYLNNLAIWIETGISPLTES